MKNTVFICLILTAVLWCDTAIGLTSKIITIEPYIFHGPRGIDTMETELGVIEVPLFHSKAEGKNIRLTFMRIAGPTDSKLPPIFFLEGGPGAPAIKPGRFSLYQALRAFNDVVVLDQRGTGMSEENLSCPLFFTYPESQEITVEIATKLHLKLARECRQYLQNEGIEIRAYNTVESAGDIYTLSRLLGYQKICIAGMSYGSHLGLSIMRYFPEIVEKVILAGVEGYDHTYKYPSTIDHHLEGIQDLIKQDSLANSVFPEFGKFVYETIEKLEKEPIKVTISRDGSNYIVPITSFIFKQFVTGMIGRRDFIAAILTDFGEIKDGKYESFALEVFEAYYNRDISLNPLSICMDCSSGISDERKASLEKDTSVFAEAVNFPFPQICEALDIRPLPGKFRSPLSTAIPTLFISGVLDGRTPISNVLEISKGFSNYSLISIKNMGHDTNGLFLENGVMDSIGAFLKDRPIQNLTFEAAKIKFH